MKKTERIYGEEILKNWANAKGRITDLQREINFLKENTKSVFYDEMQENDEINSVYKEVLFEMLNEMKKRMIQYKKVEAVVNNLEKFEKNIILNRYEKKYSWEKIAMENHISRTNCFNIKNKIIKKLLDEDFKY